MPEPSPELAIRGQFGADDFDRDRLPVCWEAHEHLSHAAGAHQPEQTVRPDLVRVARL